MDVKRIQSVEIKDADKGEVSAVFSTFNVVDKDGDVTLPGAFSDGAEVVVSAYGHTSWSGALPVGTGRIRTTDIEAIADMKFFLDTAAGRDTFKVVKRLGSRQEWSYGFDIDDAEAGVQDGQDVRLLKGLSVHEVSPVLVGAGVNTRTISAKARKDGAPVTAQYKAAIRPHKSDTTAREWDGTAVVSALPDDASVSDLRSVHAWVDTSGDPEAKTNYRFPHHHGPNGPANLRACVTGIAVLNGARGGTTIPDADRQGVYNHLASHLRDADREPPELRSGTGDLKFYEQVLDVMAVASELKTSAARVVALRAEKGKSLSHINIEGLGWLYEEWAELGRWLKTLLDTPQEAAATEHVRFLAQRFKEQQS